MRDITLEELLEAGCHFGHQVTRQNPKARDFVFEARDNIHIIDLAKTKEGLDNAAKKIKELAQDGKTLLVVGTKRQAQAFVQEEVKRAREEIKDTDAAIHFVTSRWIGGSLTNFQEVTKNFRRIDALNKMLTDESVKAQYTKRELGLFAKEKQKLEGFYEGMHTLKRIPDVLFIVDTHTEDLAVREALVTGVTTVGIVDTNADPFVIDYPIPANDDAIGSIKLIVSHIINAWIEGKVTKDNSESRIQNSELKEEKGELEEKKSDKKVSKKKIQSSEKKSKTKAAKKNSKL